MIAGLVAAAVGIVITIQSCGMAPGPRASREQIAAIARSSLAGRSSVGATPAIPELSYLHAGDPDGPRVIYIHGTPGSGDGWADFLVDPVAGWESIAVDRLGFGKSGPKGGEPSFQTQAEAIAPLLVERRGRKPIVVGHSLGGPIAARLAADHPDLVGGLVIVAGSLDPEQEKPGLAQSIATTDLVRFFLPRALDNSMGELNAAKEQTTLLGPVLGSITCPVIIVHGTDDELVPYENVEYTRSHLTHAASVEVVTLEKQGHLIPWQRPEVIRRAVEKLARATPPDAGGG